MLCDLVITNPLVNKTALGVQLGCFSELSCPRKVRKSLLKLQLQRRVFVDDEPTIESTPALILNNHGFEVAPFTRYS
jgi:hypothetical protein